MSKPLEHRKKGEKPTIFKSLPEPCWYCGMIAGPCLAEYGGVECKRNKKKEDEDD